jgi:circadian clock protein KaiC
MEVQLQVKPMPLPKVNTGIVGLDNVLGGGFPVDRLYLVEGDPGTGKTTLAIQFLMEGARHGERVLFLSLSETEVELRTVALSHGWTMKGIDIFELSAAQQNRPAEQNTLFHPSEVELNEVTRLLLDQVERINPTRVVVDSLSELRLLAQNPLRLRRQILALKQFFAGRKCTVLLLDDLTASDDNGQAHSLAHGVISMEQPAPEYGSERRRLRVMKLRGVKFRGGWHDYSITTGGLVVFPRLVASEHRPEMKNENITSGIPELDALCGGGVSRGTSMLIIGPAGAGKTTIAMQFAYAAMRRGEHTAVFLFDENLQTLMTRCSSVGMNVRDDREKGLLTAQQIDPAEMPPGEFSHIVRGAVERDRARVVVIDSLNGYMNAMPQERFLLVHMHELLTYLAHQGVLTILTMAQHGLVGKMESPIDLSYLSDSVLSVRYFESRGEIMQSIAVLKKRTGPHERTLREFRVTQQGIRIGAPLRDFHGVLTGVPVFAGGNTNLFKGEHA